MEEYKKDDRGRSKAKRLTMNDPHTKVDSSTWTPDAAENAGVKTGARPLVKRLYKKGGKVVGKHEGKDSVKHAGRMPRKAGGRTDKLTPDSLINRDVRTANEVREGKKHDGAFKKGGVAKYGKGGRMPLEGHPYHKKTDAELRYISKDAAEAARSMKGMDSKAENKYLDQMNDAQTVLGHRQRTGNGPESGMKKGGRTHKLGGGMVGDNPLSVQDRSMAKASGMMKKGGRAKKRADGGDAIADMIRQDQIEQGMKGRGLPERVPMPPRRPADKPMTPRDPIPTSTNFGAKKGGKIKHPDEKADRQLIKSMIKPTAFKAKGGKVMHHDDCTCKMCGGGRAMKYSGGGIFSGDSKKKVPGDVGGRHARKDGGRNVGYDESAPPQASYNFLTGWSNLDKASPDQIAAMNPTNRAAAMSAQGNAPQRMGGMPAAGYGAGARKSAPDMRINSQTSRMSSDPSGLSMMDPQQRAEFAQQTNGLSADQQRGMMGRQPQMSTQHGLFMGRPDQAGIVFSRDVPDQNAQPVYHSGDSTPEMTLRDLGEKRGGRTERNKGGRTKGNTTIIIDMGGRKQMQPQPMGMGQMPNAPVNPMRQPQQQPPMPPQGGMPPMPPMPPQGMPMQRKAGGRTSYPIETGSGGGEARLDKIKAYGLKPSKRK